MNTFKCKVKGKLDPIIVEDVTSVANAFGVLKNEYNVNELDVLSIELIEPEYTISDWYDSIKDDLKPWMWGRYGRSCCPQEMKYNDMKLDKFIKKGCNATTKDFPCLLMHYPPQPKDNMTFIQKLAKSFQKFVKL